MTSYLRQGLGLGSGFARGGQAIRGDGGLLSTMLRGMVVFVITMPLASAVVEAQETVGSVDSLTLADVAAGRAKLVDLTYVLNEKNAYWPGPGYEPFHLRTIATLERDGVLSKAFSMPEHLGTHIDAPNHFEADRPDVAAIRPDQLIGPGVVIDLSLKGEHNADALLTLDDLRAWEATHGAVPKGAIVLLHTGWGRFWHDYSRYMNRDEMGRLHFPSYSREAAEFLVHQRGIRGLGIDTLSIDPGTSRDFAVHHVVNRASRYGLENVANLDQLPPRGFFVIVAPLRIEHGSGGPARIMAVVPPTAE